MKMPPLPGTYDDTRRDNTRVSSHRIESKWRIRSLCIFLCTNVDNTKRDTYVISLARVTRKKLTNDAPHLMHKWCFDSTPLGYVERLPFIFAGVVVDCTIPLKIKSSIISVD